MGETLSAAAASRLATKIQIYWASRGLAGVKVWAEPLESINEEGQPVTVFQVRSNISDLIRGKSLVS